MLIPGYLLLRLNMAYSDIIILLVIMTSHVMGRHYVFNLILEIFDFSEKFYRSGRVTITNPWMSVCLSPGKTNFNSKSYKSIFEIYTYLN